MDNSIRYRCQIHFLEVRKQRLGHVIEKLSARNKKLVTLNKFLRFYVQTCLALEQYITPKTPTNHYHDLILMAEYL
jgi:hypothetical protein